MAGILAATALLLALQGPGPGGNGAAARETMLVAGSIRLEQMDLGERTRVERRFELVIQRRNGRAVQVEACLFADLIQDRTWNGDCFYLPVTAFDADDTGPLVNAAHLVPSDPLAQRILRLIMIEGNATLRPARRILGLAPGVPIQVRVESFPEIDL